MQVNKIGIKEVIYYLCMAGQLFYLQNFLIFQKKVQLFHCFSQVFLDIWISHMLKEVVHHTTIQKYINWKTKYKKHTLIVKGLTTGR